MKLLRHICYLILLGVIASAPLALCAQTTPAPSSRPQSGGAPGIMQGPAATGIALGGPVGMLTDQQRSSYEAAINKERATINDLQAKLRAARQDFLEASLDQKFNEFVLRQKALAASQFEAELAVVRAKAMSQIQPPLTPEQIAKIKAGQSGPVQPLRRPQSERPAQRAPVVGSTNQDANGLPPKK